jgi:hypothetical protein
MGSISSVVRTPLPALLVVVVVAPGNAAGSGTGRRGRSDTSVDVGDVDRSDGRCALDASPLSLSGCVR